MEQGRLASVHMRTSKPLNNKELSDDKKMDDPDRVRTRMRSGEVFPFGIYTVPEISMVGKNEQQLTKEQVPYEVGMARYEELARGQMLGGLPGFLKIIFCPETLKILGVHAIGEGATEIIHIGQVVMSTGGTLGTSATLCSTTRRLRRRTASLHSTASVRLTACRTSKLGVAWFSSRDGRQRKASNLMNGSAIDIQIKPTQKN